MRLSVSGVAGGSFGNTVPARDLVFRELGGADTPRAAIGLIRELESIRTTLKHYARFVPAVDERNLRVLDDFAAEAAEDVSKRVIQASPGELDALKRETKLPVCRPFGDGASRTRTGDLLGAIQALSQLSYSPARAQGSYAQAAGWETPCLSKSFPALIVAAMSFDSSR
jgi:hypothetical protein